MIIPYLIMFLIILAWQLEKHVHVLPVTSLPPPPEYQKMTHLFWHWEKFHTEIKNEEPLVMRKRLIWPGAVLQWLLPIMGWGLDGKLLRTNIPIAALLGWTPCLKCQLWHYLVKPHGAAHFKLITPRRPPPTIGVYARINAENDILACKKSFKHLVLGTVQKSYPQSGGPPRWITTASSAWDSDRKVLISLRRRLQGTRGR